MTMDERAKAMIGDLAVQVMSLATRLEVAHAKIAELEAAAKSKDEKAE